MEKYAERYCSIHPKQKMCLLFTSYVCDICNPPSGVQTPVQELCQERFLQGDRVEYINPMWSGGGLNGSVIRLELLYGQKYILVDWDTLGISHEKPEHLKKLG